MKEITLTKEQYEALPYKNTAESKDDTFGAIVGLLRKHGIRKYFMDEEEETFTFILTVKQRDMERMFPVKIRVPHLLYMMKVDPRSRAKNPPMQLTYLEKVSWRIAWWYLKSKLEAVTYGISDDFKEFMPNIYHVLPDQREIDLSDIILNAKKLDEFLQIEDKTEENKPIADNKKIEAEYRVVEVEVKEVK